MWCKGSIFAPQNQNIAPHSRNALIYLTLQVADLQSKAFHDYFKAFQISNPKRITKNNPQETAQQSLADFGITKWRFSASPISGSC